VAFLKSDEVKAIERDQILFEDLLKELESKDWTMFKEKKGKKVMYKY
jgi:hypothetical protein